jgi:hypothetical protein
VCRCGLDVEVGAARMFRMTFRPAVDYSTPGGEEDERTVREVSCGPTPTHRNEQEDSEAMTEMLNKLMQERKSVLQKNDDVSVVSRMSIVNDPTGIFYSLPPVA